MAHCASANDAFVKGMRSETFPPLTPEEFGRMVWEAGRDTVSREEAIRLIQGSTAEVLDALSGLTPERLASSVPSPFGPIPMAMWMTIADGHMTGHAHQIEYLQTIWGDHQNHMM